MLNATMAISLVIALGAGLLAFAGDHHRPKKVSWAIFVFSSAALAAGLLASYLSFVLMEIPYLGGSG